MQALPFISSLMRCCSRLAAIPLGCLSVLVTWLNLMTISPSSQAAETAPALTVRVNAVNGGGQEFSWVSSQNIRSNSQAYRVGITRDALVVFKHGKHESARFSMQGMAFPTIPSKIHFMSNICTS